MAITQGNLGVVKNNLQLYYNRESVKSFRGEATTNIVTADYDNFENAVGSYSAINNTATRTNELFYFGGYSLKIVRSSSGADGYVDMEGYINVSASTTYTYSVYVYTATITQSINILRPVYFTSANAYVGESSGGTITSSDVGKWKRVSHTFTTPNNCTKIIARLNVESSSYYPLVYYIDGRQIEQKSYATPFVISARTANTYAGGGGLIDLSGNSVNADLTNVSFNSDGYYFTTAGNNYLNTGITTLPSNTQLTIDVWTKPTSTTQTKTLVSKWGSSGQSNFCFLLFLNWFAQGNIYFLVGNSAGTSYSTHSIPHNLSTSAYSNFTVVYDNGLVSWYRNGVFIQTDTNGNTPLKSVTTAITIGADYDGGNPDTLTRSYDGTIPNVKLYSRPLTTAEVLRNFESQRKVYGI